MATFMRCTADPSCGHRTVWRVSWSCSSAPRSRLGPVLSCRVVRPPYPPERPLRTVLSPLVRRVVRGSGIRTGGGAAFGALNQRRAIELRYACTLVGVPWAVGGWMHWHAACHSSVDVPSSLGTISVSRTSGSGQRWESGDPQPISHALLVLAVDEACDDVGPGSCPQVFVTGSPTMFMEKCAIFG